MTYSDEYAQEVVTLSLADGGQCGHNNPSFLALREAQRLWPDSPVVLVSLGTGLSNLPRQLEPSKFQVIRRMVELATSAEGTHRNLMNLQPGLHHYCRFNPPLGRLVCPLDTKKPELLRRLRQCAEEYVASEEFLQEARALAEFEA